MNDEKAGSSKTANKLGYVLFGVVSAAAIGLCAITIPFVSPALRKICLPYVPATNKQVENAILGLRGRTGKVVDLGSGDGRIVVAAAKRGFKAEGVELNLWLVFYSRFYSWRNKTHHLTSFYRKNLWKVNLSSYENVVIFGTQELMSKLDTKLIDDEFKGLVVVCRFPFEDRTPSFTIGEGIDTVWGYHFDKFCQ